MTPLVGFLGSLRSLPPGLLLAPVLPLIRLCAVVRLRDRRAWGLSGRLVLDGVWLLWGEVEAGMVEP